MALYLGQTKIASGGNGVVGTAGESTVSDLKLNCLTEEQYTTAKTNNQINDNELYLTPDDISSGGISLLDVYPVGSIYMSINNINPSTLFGGTWVAWGAGRVPIGVDTTQSEFDTVEKTGGEKTHQLNIDEMPSHTHIPSVTIHGNSDGVVVGSDWSEGFYTRSTAGINLALTNAGGSQPHNNLQPYITCYMWKRTS